jgi:hypothetical protein
MLLHGNIRTFALVAILPPGEALAGDVSTLQPLTPTEVEQAVAALRQHPLGVDQDVRVSLGGLQSKLLLVQVDGGWARPVGEVRARTSSSLTRQSFRPCSQ